MAKETTKKERTTIPARLRYLRMAPRKVRLAVDTIRGLDVNTAIDQLQLMDKLASVPLLKLLQSAVTSAEKPTDPKDKIERDRLFVKAITVDEGPTLKRYRPRAYGRATMLRKRSSHVRLTLGVHKAAEFETKMTKPPVTKQKRATTNAKEK